MSTKNNDEYIQRSKITKEFGISKNIVSYAIKKYNIPILHIKRKSFIHRKWIKEMKSKSINSKSNITNILKKNRSLILPTKVYDIKEFCENMGINENKFKAWKSYYEKKYNRF